MIRELKAFIALSSLLFFFSGIVPLSAQRGGPPRRITHPQTIHLEGGARVEFREFPSKALGGSLSYSVFLPPSYDREPHRRYPTIYFLHGLFNDHTSWAVERYGNIPAQIEKMMKDGRIPEFVAVHPAGGRGFYTDTVDGARLSETAVESDLIEEVEKTLRVIPKRRARALGGTSMGGYGALKIAMKHPELYASVAAGSPIVFLGDNPMDSFPPGDNRFVTFLKGPVGEIFGNPVDREHWRKNSVEALAKSADLDGLNIYFFYGTADRFNQMIPLEKGVRRLDEILSERHIKHRFKVMEGGHHGWELVRDDLEEMVRFLSQTFEVE